METDARFIEKTIVRQETLAKTIIEETEQDEGLRKVEENCSPSSINSFSTRNFEFTVTTNTKFTTTNTNNRDPTVVEVVDEEMINRIVG